MILVLSEETRKNNKNKKRILSKSYTTTVLVIFTSVATVVAIVQVLSSSYIVFIPTVQQKESCQEVLLFANNNSHAPAAPETSLLPLRRSTQSESRPHPHPHPDHSRTLAFLHIGKCGGSTLKELLMEGCHNKRRARHHGRCPPSFYRHRNTSALSRRIQRYYHVTDARVPFEQFTSFVIPIRDPLERAISAFCMHHPLNGIQPGRVYPDDTHFACFPTLQAFANALNTNTPHATTTHPAQQGPHHVYNKQNQKLTCRKVAQSSILGLKNQTNYMPHLYWNYQFYTSAMPPTKEVFITRTPTLWEDCSHLNQLLGGTHAQIAPYQTAHLHRLNSAKSNYTVLSKPLNEEGRAVMCEWLREEYRLYVDLVLRAVNLNDAEVEETLRWSKRNCPALFVSE